MITRRCWLNARISRRQTWFPVLLLIGSDLVLTKTMYHDSAKPDQLIIRAWYEAIVLLGGVLREDARPNWIVGASVSAALLFFLASNLGVWMGATLYPMTLTGLAQCYVTGLPFFRNELISNIVFTGLLFGLPAVQQLPFVQPHGCGVVVGRSAGGVFTDLRRRIRHSFRKTIKTTRNYSAFTFALSSSQKVNRPPSCSCREVGKPAMYPIGCWNVLAKAFPL